MKQYNEVLKNALNILAHKELYAYFYGAKGQVLTESVMNALINSEPQHFSRYTPEQLKQIKDYSRGKIGYDCSGFITAISGVTGSSANQWKQCLPNPTLAYGLCGSILYKKGHIGIDIGYGMFLHFPTEGRTCELGYIRDYDWTNSGLLKDVNYVGASCV